MWIKYEYICTNCDSLFELTTQNPLVFEPVCSCESQHIIRVNRYNVTELTEPHLDIIGEAHYN